MKSRVVLKVTTYEWLASFKCCKMVTSITVMQVSLNFQCMCVLHKCGTWDYACGMRDLASTQFLWWLFERAGCNVVKLTHL